jgi:hypothetical protein
MPTLYTSLIARRNPQLKTLAPRHQRPPIPASYEAISVEEHQAIVAEEHWMAPLKFNRYFLKCRFSYSAYYTHVK